MTDQATHGWLFQEHEMRKNKVITFFIVFFVFLSQIHGMICHERSERNGEGRI